MKSLKILFRNPYHYLESVIKDIALMGHDVLVEGKIFESDVINFKCTNSKKFDIIFVFNNQNYDLLHARCKLLFEVECGFPKSNFAIFLAIKNSVYHICPSIDDLSEALLNIILNASRGIDTICKTLEPTIIDTCDIKNVFTHLWRRYFRSNDVYVSQTYQNIPRSGYQFATHLLNINDIDFSKDLTILFSSQNAFSVETFIAEGCLSIKNKNEFYFQTNNQIYLDFIKHFEILAQHKGDISQSAIVENHFMEHALISDTETIAVRLEKIVRTYPDNTAVIIGYNKYSYAELNHLANQIAHYVYAVYGDVSNKPIGLGMTKSIELIAGLFAILKLGAYYVPLDPNYPDERINSIVSETDPVLILSNNEKSARLSSRFCVAYYDHIKDLEYGNQNLNLFFTPLSLAYVIFTSGSTGKPKGVMIGQSAIINLVNAQKEACTISCSSKVLLTSSIGFDAAGWDIYGALLNGAGLIVANDHIQSAPEEIATLIAEHAVTHVTLTPSVLALLPYDELPSVQLLIVMGDKCPLDVLNRWAKKCKVMNGYGPTEATVGASLGIYKEGISPLCIGKPLPGYQFYILDEWGNFLPKGIIGELYIGGYGLAHGYFHDDMLTETKFLFINKSRLYKTGDLAYERIDGAFEFFGRADSQVKIRGVRVELQEIENLLLHHPYIEEAVVITNGEGIDKQIYAYFKSVTTQKIKPEIQAYLKNNLHAAAVPSQLIQVDRFDLTPNGKIDKNNLPEVVFDQQSYCAPQNYTEKQIVKIFQLILKHENIGIFDDFFMLGGHSLTATQIAARASHLLNVKIDTRHVLEFPTPNALSNFLQDTKLKAYSQRKIILEKREGPLTSAQKRLWYLYHTDTTNVSYNLPRAIRFMGALNIQYLEQAIQKVAQNYETFRTIFGQNNGIPYQRILDKSTIHLQIELVDESQLEQVMTNYTRIPFNLEQEIPLKIILFHIAEDNHILFFVKHNIITDAWSEGLIIKNLAACYNNPQHVLSRCDAQCIDIAYMEESDHTLDRLNDQIQYWKHQLQNHNLFEFPLDKIRPGFMDGAGDRIRFTFDVEAWGRVKKIAQQYKCTPFVAIMTVLNILFARYTEQTDIILGTALAGRQTNFSEEATGFFVNTLPIRTIFNFCDSLIDVLTKTKDSCFGAYSHQNLPFEHIVDQVGAERFINKNPLFQIMVVLQNADETEMPEFNALEIEHIFVATNTTMFDMVFNFVEIGKQLCVDLDYSTNLFLASSIMRMLENLNNVLMKFNVEAKIQNLDILSDSEKNLLHICANGSTKILPYRTVMEWFLQTVDQNYEKVAIVFDNIQYTYGELLQKIYVFSKQIRTKIQRYNQARIGILLQRSDKVVVSILGTLFSNAYYIPLDPDYPQDRIQSIIDDAQIDLLVVDGVTNTLFNFPNTLNIDVMDFSIIHSNDAKLRLPDFGRYAYILYTSGSSGTPKGVIVTHKNLVNLCMDFIDRVPINSKDTLLSITTISFDIFGLELFCSLLAGAKLILSSQECARNPVKLVNLFNQLQPSIMQATPTMWSAVIDHLTPNKKLAVLCGGEVMNKTLLKKLQKKSEKILNVYGPTETTIWSTVSNLSKSKHVTIGKPILNTQCYVLDRVHNMLPYGAVGNLAIGGFGVSDGYLNKPQLTTERFIQLPSTQSTVYLTGDRVKLDQDMNLIYLGREDDQVKIRGHRIELQEIEACIEDYKFVHECACKIWGDGYDTFIAAYIKSSELIDTHLLRTYLEQKLPIVMVPSMFVFLDDIPKTANNKKDRKKLQKPKNDGFSNFSGKFEEAASQLEKEIQEIWECSLKKQKISVIENFFVVGGNSLLVPQILGIINKRYDLVLTIRDFILNSTIRELAALVTKNCEEVL